MCTSNPIIPTPKYLNLKKKLVSQKIFKIERWERKPWKRNKTIPLTYK